jgi:multicomponent Na+:H+ antiporter subunit B
MKSVILRTAIRFMMPLLLLFSIFLLVRGHNQSGGGFAGGLVAASAFALYSLSYGATSTRDLLRLQQPLLIAVGLLVSLLSGMVALLFGRPFLTGMWGYLRLPGLGAIELGTPVFFDIGVYLLVTGVTLLLVFTLEEVN